MALKPVEMLSMVSATYGWSAEELARKEFLLQDALLNPHVDPRVKAVYAHDFDAVRVCCLGGYDYAVERYDPGVDNWVQVNTHPSYDEALTAARNWGMGPDKARLKQKWDKVRDSRIRDCPAFLRTPFPDKASLAEFWYDTKPLSWPETFGASPWEFASSVASSLFVDRGVPALGFADEYRTQLSQAVELIVSEWAREKLASAYVVTALGEGYDFFEGGLRRESCPVMAGGFSSRMTESEREVCDRAVALAAAVFDGDIWGEMDARARGNFLAARFVARSSGEQQALETVTQGGWESFNVNQRAALGRQLADWLAMGESEGLILRAKGYAPTDPQSAAILAAPPVATPPVKQVDAPSRIVGRRAPVVGLDI